MQRFFRQFMPFVFFGIAIVAFAFGIILLAYLFLFGAIVGLILYIIVWIRQKFFPSKVVTRPNQTKKSGQIIDSDDFKKL